MGLGPPHPVKDSYNDMGLGPPLKDPHWDMECRIPPLRPPIGLSHRDMGLGPPLKDLQKEMGFRISPP